MRPCAMLRGARRVRCGWLSTPPPASVPTRHGPLHADAPLLPPLPLHTHTHSIIQRVRIASVQGCGRI
jgi:hypothetical protein